MEQAAEVGVLLAGVCEGFGSRSDQPVQVLQGRGREHDLPIVVFGSLRIGSGDRGKQATEMVEYVRVAANSAFKVAEQFEDCLFGFWLGCRSHQDVG